MYVAAIDFLLTKLLDKNKVTYNSVTYFDELRRTETGEKTITF